MPDFSRSRWAVPLIVLFILPIVSGAVDWDGVSIEEPNDAPLVLVKRKPRVPRVHSGTVEVDEGSIVVFSDQLFSFSMKTKGYPVGSFVDIELESGTVFEIGAGEFTDPKFKRWKTLSAEVLFDETAHIMTSLRGLQDGYVRIRFPGRERPDVPPAILTFPVQGVISECGRNTIANPCRILHGYQGAGRN